MLLTSLRLRDFRCFESLHWEPAEKTSFITGRNAQGKTSILEAICLLTRLQSPRTSTPSEAIRFGQPTFAIEGILTNQNSNTRLQFQYGKIGRRLWVDSVPQSQSSDYLNIARIVWLASEDMLLTRGPAGQRRRFLDFIGSQTIPGYLKQLRSYERALRARNLLLKEGRSSEQIAAYSKPLIQAGNALLSARAQLLQDLTPFAEHAATTIGQRQETLMLTYKPGVAHDFESELYASRERESRIRQTVVGPHRDDFEISLNKIPAAIYASEGQQRTIALALKLAQAELLQNITSIPPLLLIDDVFGELDPPRRNAFLHLLPPNSQCIITTTFIDWAERPNNTEQFEVNNATLVRVH